jgi:biopolymer transport protein TolQ
LNEIDLLSLLRQTTPVSRFVLGVLLIFSIWSWGIILQKSLHLKKIRKESVIFWRMFRKGQSLSEIATASENFRFTPLAPVFNAGADLMKPAGPAAGQGSLALKTSTVSLGTIQRAMQRTAAAQLTKVEERLTFLATTASVTPFIGLFGTVWGVLTSFTGLGNAETVTLRAVAPGIAEALIATAFGLFAAIPAVIAYNHYIGQIRNIGGEIDDLQVEMLALAERNGL